MTKEVQPPDQIARWIHAAKEGSQEALGEALQACWEYLLRVADQEFDAELGGKVNPSDIVQNTFLEAQRGFAQFRGSSKRDLLVWLRRILLNNLAETTRHYRGTEKRELAREVPLSRLSLDELHDGLIEHESPSAHAWARERDEELEQALKQLPAHYREVILLRHEQQLSFKEIAEKLGCSVDAVSKRWGRAIHQLEKHLRPPDESR